MFSKLILMSMMLTCVSNGCAQPNDLCEGVMMTCEGERFEIQGTISDIPNQHMINIPEGYENINYLDSDNYGQRVVYSKDLIGCDGQLNIIGEVVRIEGESKDPASDEVYIDYQIKAEEWVCL